MRTAFVLFLLVLGGLSQALSGQPSPPSERIQWTTEQWDEALAPFVKKARAELPEVVRRFQREREADPPATLLLVTRRPGSDGKPVEIILNVTEVSDSGIYYGTVSGKQPENSPVGEGDRLGIVASDVYDWGLRLPKGKPEGLAVTRARNALVTGVMVAVFDVQSDKKGRLIHVEMARAIAVGTGDDVTDLVPATVASDGCAHLREYYQSNRVPERFAEVSLYFSFPAGELLQN